MEKAINGFQELRGGGVSTQMSMIFAILFHKFYFDHILSENIEFLTDSQNVKNTNYLIKGLHRIFEADLEK